MKRGSFSISWQIGPGWWFKYRRVTTEGRKKEGKKKHRGAKRGTRTTDDVDLALLSESWCSIPPKLVPAAALRKDRRPVIAGASSAAPEAAICVEQERVLSTLKKRRERSRKSWQRVGTGDGGNILLDAL